MQQHCGRRWEGQTVSKWLRLALRLAAANSQTHQGAALDEQLRLLAGPLELALAAAEDVVRARLLADAREDLLNADAWEGGEEGMRVSGCVRARARGPQPDSQKISPFSPQISSGEMAQHDSVQQKTPQRHGKFCGEMATWRRG